MAPDYLFISDLHLSEDREDLSLAFERCLDEYKGVTKHLYILGDFFEAWVGDDDDSAWLKPINAAIQAFVESGAEVYFVHGNRDFLVGEAWANQVGAKLLLEPTVITLDNGCKWIVCHGDELCTDDTEYQQFRAMSRNPQWQAGMLQKPLVERKMIAAHMRAESKMKNGNKASNIMDVNADAVRALLERSGADWLIHGHTHRPEVNEAQQRIVLGDWGPNGYILEASKDGDFKFRHIPIEA